MAINESLPIAGLSNSQITLSADQSTVLFEGVEIPTQHFIKVTVPSLLGFYQPGSASAIALLSELDANGFNIKAYGNHTSVWARTVVNQREDQARRAEAVRQHAERMAAIHATPEEIAKANADRKAKQEAIAQRYGDRGRMAAFGG